MLSRLLLAESINPGASTLYDEANSKKAMQWMRLVIKNRLEHEDPSRFSAKKQAGKNGYDIFDIVKASGQFHGFENYPSLGADITRNIAAFIAIATNHNHPKQQAYADYISNAISVAHEQGLSGVTDPCPTKLYGWRTKGSSAPGGSFEFYKDLAGQTFYTLKK